MHSQVALKTVGRVGDIASSAAPPLERLEEVMVALRAVIPHEACHVAHRSGGTTTSLLNEGYHDHIVEHFESEAWFRQAKVVTGPVDPHQSVTLRQCDLEDPEDNMTVREYLRPEGFNEGVSCLIHSATGSLQAVVNLSVARSDRASDEAREVIDVVACAIGNLVDATSVAERGHATYVVDEIGQLRYHSGPSDLNSSADHAAVEEQVRRHGHGQQLSARFTLDADERLLQVIPLRNYASVAAQALVVVRDAPPLPLSSREVDVLRLIVGGHSNPQIADSLGVARRTVAAHIEHILTKLGLNNRTEAAVWACQSGVLPKPQ